MMKDRILNLLRNGRSQLAQWDYLLPGDYVGTTVPTQRRWIFWRRPVPINDELLEWAGEIARARTLMDMDAAIASIEQMEGPE